MELNPCRSGPKVRPEEWPWSSYRATTGLALPAPFHSPSVIWKAFGDEPRRAMSAWQAYVEAGLNETSLVSDTGGTRPL